MGEPVFYQAGSSEAVCHASAILKRSGILFTQEPGNQATDLLLDVPSFSSPGILRSGKAFEDVLSKLPKDIRVWGGNMPRKEGCLDLLSDPEYKTKNGVITADCALRLCGTHLKNTWGDSAVLVIGWGKIGKPLCRMLKSLGAQVTVCARKAPDRALCSALGYDTVAPDSLNGSGYQVVFNTAPELNLPEEKLGNCPLPIDLASRNGLLGSRVIKAGGLPGIYAPATSGKLIAATILKMLRR